MVVLNVKVYIVGKKMVLLVEGCGEFFWLLIMEEGEYYKGCVMGGKKFNLLVMLLEGYYILMLIQDE